MKPWLVMGILAVAIVAGRWFLWAYPGVSEVSAHISWLFPRLSTS